MRQKREIPFENLMTKTQTVFGWVYLLAHVALLPLLLGLLKIYSPEPIDDARINLIYYCIGVVFCLTVTFTFLRRSYDRLADNLRRCILTMALALLMDYALSGAAALVLMLVDGVTQDPNTEAIMGMAQESGAIKAAGIFLAPIVEEVLFRGVLYGSLRTRSRAWAYIVSVAAFSLYHVWQYAVAAGDAKMLLYAVQYIPVSIVLAWAYERSGTIWTGIFFHMGFNALSFCALEILDKL